MNNMLRITGLATGLDVDSVIKQMMRAHTMRLDKIKQDRQVITWRQELYRGLIGDMNTFKSTYFDILKPDSHMLSERNYSSFDVSINGTNSPLSVTASGGAVPGDYKVTVNQLAEKARIEGKSEINISEAVSGFSFPAEIVYDALDPDNSNNIIEFSFSEDSTIYKIDLLEDGAASDVKYLPDLAARINSKLSTAEGGDISKKVVAVAEGHTIKFYSMKEFDADTKITITDSADPENIRNYSITIEKGTYNMSQLKSIVNEKLKNAKDENGASSPVDLSGRLSTDVSPGGDSLIFSGTDIGVDNSIILSSEFDITNKNQVTGTNNLEYDRKIISGKNDSLTIKVGENQYTISLDSSMNYGTESNPAPGFDTKEAIFNDLVSKLNEALKFATDKNGDRVDLTDTVVDATKIGANLSFRVSQDQSKIQVVSNSSKTISISGNGTKSLGFPSSFEINQGVGSRASGLLTYRDDVAAESLGKVDFVINGVRFKYNFNSISDEIVDPDDPAQTITGAKNMTISNIIDDIYSKANVKLSYSQLTRKFMLESDVTGAAQSIYVEMGSDLSEDAKKVTNDFLNSIFGSNDVLPSPDGDGYFDRISDEGKDAIVTIVNPDYISQQGYEGNTVVKSNNSFTIDGVTYNLNKVSEKDANGDFVPTTITLTKNSQKTFDKIKEFVDKYNELIGKINEKVDEKKQYKYLPLTDEQKNEMSEDEIKKWEEKAKEGLLSGDSTLANMLYNMRNAFYDAVQTNYDDSRSIGVSLSSIGITTSNNISERGKLIIDEKKLKDALDNNGDKVANLFTKISSSQPSYSPDMGQAARSARYKEEGLFQRINDIFQDNLRTFRNNNGQKGTLLEKAGIKGDYTEFDNLLTDELNKKDKMLNELADKLLERENRYYLQFSKLETAMQRLNDQSNWLYQQLGLSNGGQ